MSVILGSKWTPAHVVIRNPDAGIYMERNPKLDSVTELRVQRALLLPEPKEAKRIQSLRGENWSGNYG